jgi:predicted transcriptional regulator
MRPATLFLSIKPTFASKILRGAKTIELRRVRPNVTPGDTVLIYSSSPEMALLGSAWVEEILGGAPRDLWSQVKDQAGVSRQEYDEYFSGASMAIGIRLGSVQRLSRPIPLRELRERWPWLRPPQSYRYVDARLDPDGGRVTSLAPRLLDGDTHARTRPLRKKAA